MLKPVLAAVAATQDAAFTRQQALAAGYDEDAIESLVRRGQWVVLRRGVYVERAVLDALVDPIKRHLLYARAALLRLAGEVLLSHETGAVGHGLRVLTLPADCHVTRPSEELRSPDHYQDLYVHRAAVLESHVDPGSAMRSLSAARSVCDIARLRGVEAGVVAADSALQYRRCSKDEIAQIASFMLGWPGGLEVARMAELADGRGESVGESVSRLRLMDTDLPQPEPQFKVYANGRLLGISDFGWEEYGLLGEVDGRVKYRDDPFGAVWSERTRQQSLQDAGKHVVRWTHDEALYEFGDVVVPRIRRELDRAIAMRSA